MQSAQPLNQLLAGAKVEVISIAEQNADIEILGKVALGEPFDGCLRANRHEHRRLDIAVCSVQHSGPGAGDGAFSLNFECDLRHYPIVRSDSWRGRSCRLRSRALHMIK